MTGTVHLDPTIDADHVTSRQVTVTVNGAALPPIEAISTEAVFQCAAGDAIVITDQDFNSAGGSDASDPFSITATLPAVPPAKPRVAGVTFAA